MRLVKKSVNQDDPGTYHLFYADADGHPGTDLTFFPFRILAPGRSRSWTWRRDRARDSERELRLLAHDRLPQAARTSRAPRIARGDRAITLD